MLDRAEAADKWDSEEVSTVMKEFTRKHFLHVSPFPEDTNASIRLEGEDNTAIRAM